MSGSGFASSTTTSTISSTTTMPTSTSTTSMTVVGVTARSGQTVTVQVGTDAYRPVIQAGGELVVNGGASASSLTLSPTGTLLLEVGASATANGFSNATLELASTTGTTGLLNAANLALSSSTGTLRVEAGGNWVVSGAVGSTGPGTTISGTTAYGTTIPGTVVGGPASLTLVNSGTIAFSGTAVLAAVTGTTRGLVYVGTGGDLDVRGAVATGQTVNLGGASTLELGSTFGGVLANFVRGDTLVIDNFTGTTAVVTGGDLVIGEAGRLYGLELAGTPGNESFIVTASNGKTFVTDTVPCFCSGTLIDTPHGEVAVELLAIGDIVLTASGRHRPVKWIGRRSYAGCFLRANPGVQPIRFRAGSLGGGMPRRDLLLSPDHALFIDGVLVPAACLVNGATIAVDRTAQRVDYLHVELDTHDVLLAEGVPAESFTDDDSRGMFANAAEHVRLSPEATRPGGFCAPRVQQGEALEAIRRRLAAVAA